MPFMNNDNRISFIAYSSETHITNMPYIYNSEKNSIKYGYHRVLIPPGFATVAVAMVLIGVCWLLPLLFSSLPAGLLYALHGLLVGSAMHLLIILYGILNDIVITVYQGNVAYYFPNHTDHAAVANTTNPFVTAIGWGITASFWLSGPGCMIAGIAVAILDATGVLVFPFHFFMLTMIVGLVIAQVIAGIMASKQEKPIDQAYTRNLMGYITLPIVGLLTVGTYITLNLVHWPIASFMASPSIIQAASISIGVIAVVLLAAMGYFFLHSRDGENDAAVIFLCRTRQVGNTPIRPRNSLLLQKNKDDNQFRLISHNGNAIVGDPITTTDCTRKSDCPLNTRLAIYSFGIDSHDGDHDLKMTLPTDHPLARDLFHAWMQDGEDTPTPCPVVVRLRIDWYMRNDDQIEVLLPN